ncbi:hypothetical protein MASR2M39_17460 [Ignavibacteriales bacterium]
MRAEYVNSEKSIIEKLCNTEKSQALIIVSWLGAPEDVLLKKLRQHIDVVDLSRKVINFYIPNQKVKSSHNRARTRFDFSKTRKVFYISTASLPFIPILKLTEFFELLRFDPDDINLIFLMKGYNEAVSENHKNHVKHKNCYADQSMLDSHDYSTGELYNFINDICESFLYNGYKRKLGDVDLVIACNSLMTIVEDLKTGSFAPSKTIKYPTIPLKRVNYWYPNEELFDVISILAKEITPFTSHNKFYDSVKTHLPTSQEFLDIFAKYNKILSKSEQLMDEREHRIFRTEEEKREIDQELWRERIKVQNYLINLPNIFPLKEETGDESFRYFDILDW